MEGSAPVFDLEDGFQLGDIAVHPRRSALLRGGQEIRLEPRVMSILVELARRPGEVIGRDEFAETVWRGRVVSDEVLSHNVSVLRSALGDDARSPRFIQTVPTVGYRLVTEVQSLASDRDPASTFTLPGLVLGGVVLLLIGLSLWWMLDDETPEGLPETTIAILPFENLTDAQATEYFSDGLTEEVMGALAGVNGLYVVARTSSFVFRDTSEDVRDIGVQLGAGSILEGSVRRSGERLRVSASLVSANDGLQLWSESFDTELEDVFDVQDTIARAIVERLVGTLAPEITLSRRDTEDIEAFELFLRGNHQLYRRGPTAIGRSIELFEEAIARDPEFARAHVGLAQAHAMMPSYLDTLEMPYLEKARASLVQAEALGHLSARLLGTRAYVAFREWRWSEAEDHFIQALTMAPTDSDVRQQYSQFLGTVGRISDALNEARDAVRADPLSGVAHQRLGVVYLWVDDLAAARRHLQLAEELGLDDLATPEAMIALLARSGAFDEADQALRTLQRQRNLPEDWIGTVLSAVQGQGGIENAIETLHAAYDGGSIGSRLYLGALYFIGDEPGFYDGLDRLIDQHAAIDAELLFTPIAEGLRSSPRFDEAMDRMGISDYRADRGLP
jgi:adenylate cyclase